ncbi:MAG: hypothetical protein R3D26_07645 [Cyanobacteriota/Melainabacteria group bacterium]
MPPNCKECRFRHQNDYAENSGKFLERLSESPRSQNGTVNITRPTSIIAIMPKSSPSMGPTGGINLSA